MTDKKRVKLWVYNSLEFIPDIYKPLIKQPDVKLKELSANKQLMDYLGCGLGINLDKKSWAIMRNCTIQQFIDIITKEYEKQKAVAQMAVPISEIISSYEKLSPQELYKIGELIQQKKK